MNSIKAMELEIRSQARTLPALKVQKGEDNCLFVGSGDSYAAGLGAQYASPDSASCFHPLDFVSSPSLARGRTVYIVSVSGRTEANILAARAAKQEKFAVVAITADPGSPLAAICDSVIRLEHFRTGVSTAGTASFTASMITCVSLAMKFPMPGNIPGLLSGAHRQADKVAHSLALKADSFILLGNGLFYPAAVYCAMKLNEVLGARAHAYPTEAFTHSPLFGMRSNDVVITLGELNTQAAQVSSRLAAIGINSRFVGFAGAEIIEKLLRSAFFAQALTLKIAHRRGIMECYYLRNKKLLAISSDLIY